MFFQILLSILLGVCLGTLTGLIPGLHINLVAILLVTIAGKLTGIPLEYTVAIIISMAITHSFLDAIPSIFLGVPDPDKVAVVLPTHRMVFQGEAYQAVMLTVFGSLMSLMICISLVPLFILIFKSLQTVVKGYIGYILVGLTLLLVLQEKKKISAATIFLLSGILGILVLNMPNLNEPLLPLLSGLFGLSTLILGIKTNSKVPEQRITNIELKTFTKYKAVISAVIAGAAGSFLPGMGPSQVAILGSRIFRGLGDKGYVILVGGLNTVNMTLSIAMLYAVNKARNGAIVAISQLIPEVNLKLLMIVCAICLIVAGIATILAIILSRQIAKVICKINYKMISIAIISFIMLLVVIMSGWIGLIIVVTSTSLGILCNYLEVGKNHMMGCLLLPVILFFLS
ncbi:MAG: tripartite tricarboxylate transporter permease [archaeon]